MNVNDGFEIVISTQADDKDGGWFPTLAAAQAACASLGEDAAPLGASVRPAWMNGYPYADREVSGVLEYEDPDGNLWRYRRAEETDLDEACVVIADCEGTSVHAVPVGAN